MKAIFAVSALAAAISAQAIAADTEATTTFSGSVDAQFVYDLEAETKDVTLVEDEDSGEGFDLQMDVAVVNGPFSGTIGLEASDDLGGADDTVGAAVSFDDFVITDGKVTFGQVGSLMATDAYITDETPSAGTGLETGTADVTAGFTYMVMEGLHVQLQNSKGSEEAIAAGANAASGAVEGDPNYVTYENFTSYGVAAKYEGEMDALSYVVEGEINGSDDAPDDADPATFVGLGVTYTTDMITAMASFNNYGGSDKINELQAKVSADVAGASVSVGYYEPNLDADNDDEVQLEASYDVTEAIGVSAGYIFTTAEKAGDEVTAGVSYAQDSLEASADVTLADFDADDADPMLIELNVTYTSESGVAYYADYANQADEAAAGVAAATNKVTLGAKYAF